MTTVPRRYDSRREHATALAPSSDPDESAFCVARLATADAALAVTLRTAPREWLAARDDAPTVQFVSTYPHPDCVRAVSNPGAAVRIALAVDNWLDSLPAGVTPAVCLDSLNTLLEYAGPDHASRFLHVVAGRVRAADGTIHCHADADTVAAIPAAARLFDAALAEE